MAARKKVKAKTARKKSSSASKTTPKKASRKAAAPTARPKTKARPKLAKRITPEALLRKIVRATQKDPDRIDAAAIYAEDCVSIEPGGNRAEGLAGIREKLDAWKGMVKSQSWKAQNSFVKGNTICIEWKAELEMADGRQVVLTEVAVHQTRGGKIVTERYYYDPAALAPPGPEQAQPAVAPPQPTEPPRIPSASPPLDPLDL